jgi:hypothetical protein
MNYSNSHSKLVYDPSCIVEYYRVYTLTVLI